MKRFCVAAHVLAALALAGSRVFAGGAGKREAGGPAAIVDANTYWRYRLVGGPARINPEAMRDEGPKYLRPAYFKRCKARAMASLAKRGKDPQEWHEQFTWDSVFHSHAILNGVRMAPPPEKWAERAFDAADWTRAKRPFLMDVPLGGMRGRVLNVVRACYRTFFHVDDPTRVRGLRFHVAYRAGVRVLVNGKEVGRGNLPAGPLAPDTPALPYPAEAYYAFQDEIPPAHRGKDRRPGHAGRKEYVIAKETRGSFARLRLHKGQKDAEYRDMGWDYHYHGCYINKKGFDRLIGLRNRKSTFAIPKDVLRKGSNLLAFEVRAADLHPLALSWGGKDYGGTANWDHLWVMEVKLTAEAGVGHTQPLVSERVLF